MIYSLREGTATSMSRLRNSSVITDIVILPSPPRNITGIPLIGRLAVCLLITRLYIRYQGLLFIGGFPRPLRRDSD